MGAAALIGAVLIGGVGFAVLDHQRVPGVLARMVSPSPDATASSPPATTLPDDQPFSNARVAPQLDAVEPMTPGVRVNSAIVMSFSQPMDRPSVEMSFAIGPKVEGRLTWSDDFTLRFVAFRLAYATTYQLVVRGRSLRGVPLTGTRHWSFATVSGPPDLLAPGPRAINVPILTYHYIRENPNSRDWLGFALSVTPADFAAQMDWLARHGYHTITTEDLYAYLNGVRGLPSKPVILTFDDGYADFYTTAIPILHSHDFTADAYIVSGFVGRPGYMSSAQILEADRSGVEIGSHTATHANLASLSAYAIRSQLVESKGFLEKLLGHPVFSFCYPSGKFTYAVASEVAAAGFHDATTTRFGYSHSLADRYLWTRLRVGGGERLDQFATALLSAS